MSTEKINGSTVDVHTKDFEASHENGASRELLDLEKSIVNLVSNSRLNLALVVIKAKFTGKLL